MYRDTYATVNLDNVKHNVEQILRYNDCDYFFAALKANGYGHGAVEVARVALEAGATHFATAFLDEAIMLRREFPSTPILVLGYTSPDYFEVAAAHAITLTISNSDQIDALEIYAGKMIRVHFKYNSGMNRLGFNNIDELKEAYVRVRYNQCVDVEGLYTHFATADELNTGYYIKQLDSFKSIVNEIGELFGMIHCQNSAATLFPIDDMSFCNAIRVGLAMYGYNPSDDKETSVNLKPALEIFSHVSEVRFLETGEKVGYGGKYIAKSECVVATIPIGYADGVARNSAGRHVAINGIRYEIIGRVCMDQLMVLVDESVNIGDQVEFLGEIIKMEEVSKFYDTISYEILTTISDRVHRIYFEEGEVVGVKCFRK